MKLLVVFIVLIAAAAEGKGVLRLQEHTPSEASLLSLEFMKTLKEHSEAKSLNIPLITAQANNFFDKLFAKLSDHVVQSGYDPISLPDIEKTISVAVVDIKLQLSKGWFHELRTLHRNGDAKISYENGLFNVKLPVAFDRLMCDFNYYIKLSWILGFSGGVDGKLDQPKLFLDITFDINNLEIILQEYTIEDIGDIDLSWSGNGLVDWLANIVTDVITALFGGIFTNILDTETRKILEAFIGMINQEIQNIFG